MKVLITGATGMIGKGVLLECLDHPQIEKVITLGRSALDMEHSKLEEIIHKDFKDYSSIKDKLQNIDAAYLCMGISAAGLSEAEYREITYEYTITLAKTLLKSNPEMTCTYVSGQGTDSSEKGRMMWARVKGKTENDLLNMGFKQAFMYRPGMIIPLKGIQSKTKLYQFMYDYFMWLVKLVKFIAPKTVVNTTQIGQSMINVTLNGFAKRVLDPQDIIESEKLVISN
ncbi:MAG: NAD-dependent epimerase/dehydratase family protein [Cytophagales bacterium]